MKTMNISFPELPFAIEEAMNKLRINIKFSGNDTRVILVTSSLENEGKSFVAMQLWRMLAEAGFPSVLVDLDMRKSVLKNRHKYHTQGEIIGIDHYLSGQAELEDVVYKTNCENGYIVPCSQLLENPSALLEDSRMPQILNQLAQEYRYVILDTPPLEAVADSVLLASYSDGAILVVKSGDTSRRVIRRSLQQLETANCRLLGTVLNRVKAKGRYYGKGYGYGYGYWYGQSKDK